jgi:hypothetical protein
MAQYTFDTTAIEDAALTSKRNAVNAERAALTPPQAPFPDNQSFVTVSVRTTLLKPMVEAFIEQRLQIVADAYRQATNAQRQQVDTALGL